MSEIYPSVRTSIRHSVLKALYERPGAWLSTHDLLALVDEAESSEVLARILSDMAATGRLDKGAKTRNARGQECNTWGLSPAWRGRLAVENTWQDHTGQAADEAPPLPADSSEDEAPARQDHINHDLADALMALDAALEDCVPHDAAEALAPPTPTHVGYTLFADKLGSTNTPASAPYTGDPLDKRPYAPIPWPPAEDDAPDSAPAFTLWEDATAAVADALPFISGATSKTTPSIQETEIICAHLPVRWLPDLRLRLLGYDNRGDPVITLRINTEGHGAYLTLSTHGQIPFDPGELDFLPSVGNALCQFIDALYPYGTTRPTAAATKPSAPEAQP